MSLSSVLIVSSQMPFLHENLLQKKEKEILFVVGGGYSVDDAVVLFSLCF